MLMHDTQKTDLPSAILSNSVKANIADCLPDDSRQTVTKLLSTSTLSIFLVGADYILQIIETLPTNKKREIWNRLDFYA